MAEKKKRVLTVEQIEREKQDQGQQQKERLAQHLLQAQLQALRLKEWAVLVSFVFAGAIGRVLMQWIPSVEPLSVFAFLAGILFGSRKGFMVGASSLVASNFLVFGGQGPWTIFQALGFGAIGYLGGFLTKRPSYVSVLLMMAIGTLLFEMSVNLGSVIGFGLASIFFTFLTALPFGLVHLISNLALALSVPKLAQLIYEKGKFNEKDICLDLLDRYHRARQRLRGAVPKAAQ